MYFIIKLLNDIKKTLQEILKIENIKIEEPPKKEYGDFCTTVAFEIAKKERKDPKEIADLVVSNFNVENVKCSNIGPFINFKIDEKFWINNSIKEILELKNNYGKQNIGENKKVIVEHTSANPNKPLHLGHLRCAVIGDCVARLLKFLGFNVEVQFYVNDLGRQVAESFYGWKYLKNKEIPKDKTFDWYLGELYTEVHSMLDEKLEKEIEDLMKRIETSEEEFKDLQEMVDLCLKDMLLCLYNMGIKFDKLVFESDIVKSKIFENVTNWLLERGYIKKVTKEDKVRKEGKYVSGKEYENCYVLLLSNLGIDDLVYIRSNGVATYTAKDIAFAFWKFGKVDNLGFKEYMKYPDRDTVYRSYPTDNGIYNTDVYKVINVIGKEQTHSQNIVKLSLKLVGFEKEYENYHHLAFGLVHRKGIKLSGRKGTWKGFTVYEMIESLKEKLKKTINDERIAVRVAVSALRYELLRYEIKDDIVLDEEKILSLESDSAIYLIYSYTRAINILKKFGEFNPVIEIYDNIKDEPETIELIKIMSKFPLILKNSYENLDIKLICDYAYSLAQKFNSWYNKYPVVKDKNIYRATVVLCYSYIMEAVFNIIGIEKVERI